MREESRFPQLARPTPPPQPRSLRNEAGSREDPNVVSIEPTLTHDYPSALSYSANIKDGRDVHQYSECRSRVVAQNLRSTPYTSSLDN